MANIASVVKYFPVASETFEDNLSASIAAGATIVPVNLASEYTDGDVVCAVVDPGTANEAVFTGTKNGSQFENCVWTEGNTGVGHANGATVVDYISATHISMMTKGLLKEHNEDGTHKHVHADAVTVAGVSLSQLLPPTGVMLPFGGGAAPTGWLLCDGSAINRTTYATLFSAIGTAYGVGDGSTTFNLPDLRGKIPVGKDAGQTEFDVMGESGGEKTHVLAVSELPAHTHKVLNPQNNDYMGLPGGGGAGWSTGADPGGNNNIYQAITNNGTGGGGAHNNLQPYLVTNYIIKT
jgi:microcystin-dependent protein